MPRKSWSSARRSGGPRVHRRAQRPAARPRCRPPRRWLAREIADRMTALRCAIVGAGPAGFYAAEQLLDAGFEVDLLDALPTPFGLVRAGVAPDHPKIKIGHARLRRRPRRTRLPLLRRRRARRARLARGAARALPRGALRRRHRDDSRLGIPGEDLPGLARGDRVRRLVQRPPRLRRPRVRPLGASARSSIGNGNVAIDVARMLVLDPDELAPTDTADHAIEALRRGRGRGGRRARPPRAGAGRVHQPRAARARRARARRRRRRPGRAASSTTQARRGSSPMTRRDRAAQRRDPARLRAARRRRASRTGSCCASCARRSRSSASEDGRGHRPARRPQRSSRGDDGRCARWRRARRR